MLPITNVFVYPNNIHSLIEVTSNAIYRSIQLHFHAMLLFVANKNAMETLSKPAWQIQHVSSTVSLTN